MFGMELIQSKKVIKFEEVRQVVAEQYSRNNADTTIDMAQLRVTPELNLEVPQLGTFTMTDWSQKQLGQILGVQWSKWFNPTIVDHATIQEEIQKRFSKTHDTRKLRTTRFPDGDPGKKNCDGYIRAVLSPTYYSIDNERVFSKLEQNFGSRVTELQFMKGHLSRTGSWGTDHSDHFTALAPDIAIAENDHVYPGIHIRNSEVGFTALTIDEFLFRLVCTNGLMRREGESRLMYRQHRPIEDQEMDKKLNHVFTNAPQLWERTRRQLLAARTGIYIENMATFLEEELSRLNAPKYFRESAVKAFEKEPEHNVFGAIQAITRAAQDVDDMDARFEFEALAGHLLQKHTN